MSTYAPADLDYLAYLISGLMADRRDDIPCLDEIDVSSDDIVSELPALLDTLATRTRERRTVDLIASHGDPRTCTHCGDKLWFDAQDEVWFDARPAWTDGAQCPNRPGRTHQPADQEI